MKINSVLLHLAGEGEVDVVHRTYLVLDRVTHDKHNHSYRAQNDQLDISVHSPDSVELVQDNGSDYWISRGYMSYGPKSPQPLIAVDRKENDPKYKHDVLVCISITGLPISPRITSNYAKHEPIWYWNPRENSVKSLDLQEVWRMRPGELLTISSGGIFWRIRNCAGEIEVRNSKGLIAPEPYPQKKQDRPEPIPVKIERKTIPSAPLPAPAITPASTEPVVEEKVVSFWGWCWMKLVQFGQFLIRAFSVGS